MVFTPKVFYNQRPILTAADLDNHPFAQEYIDYIKNVRYPLDFKAWVRRKEIEGKDRVKKDREYLDTEMAYPYCKDCLKIRRHTR